MGQNFELERIRMVQEQLGDIKSAVVLDAMKNVPRHIFIPDNLQSHAYKDRPLPIGFGQTISQPYIVAYMTEQLEPFPGKKILEVGTGSGYQAAILAYLECEVYTVELLEELYSEAKKTLTTLYPNNIKIKHGSGYMGWANEAPFDAIIVTAAPSEIPHELIEQLKDGGKMIVPVGETFSLQILKLITKKHGSIFEKNLLPVRFVPMVE